MLILIEHNFEWMIFQNVMYFQYITIKDTPEKNKITLLVS